MKRSLVIPLFAWELVVLGCLTPIMIMFGKSMNPENERKLAMTAGLGLLVVLLCWPICRILPRTVSWPVGAVVGLLTPPLCAWTWAWLLPFPYWTDSFEIKLLGLVLAIPSALGGMIIGGLQARTSSPQR
jgi:hypothetical protein